MANQEKIQQLLSEAMALLHQAAKLADEDGEDIFFLGNAYEASVGWFTPDGELQESSDWNNSDCVIGSPYADGYGMEGWSKKGRPHGV